MTTLPTQRDFARMDKPQLLAFIAYEGAALGVEELRAVATAMVAVGAVAGARVARATIETLPAAEETETREDAAQ